MYGCTVHVKDGGFFPKTGTAARFQPSKRPSRALATILIKRSEATLQLGLLRWAQRDLMLFETVPELRDQREALQWRQPNNFVGR